MTSILSLKLPVLIALIAWVFALVLLVSDFVLYEIDMSQVTDEITDNPYATESPTVYRGPAGIDGGDGGQMLGSNAPTTALHYLCGQP